MHELSLAEGLVGLVLEALERAGDVRALSVQVNVGMLSGVDPDALALGYEVARRGTRLDGVPLVVRMVGVRAHCPRCERLVPVADVRALLCPCCDGPVGQVVEGAELQVESITIAEPP